MKIFYNVERNEIKHDFNHDKIELNLDRKCENISGKEHTEWSLVFSYKEKNSSDKLKWDQFLVSFERIRSISEKDLKKERFLSLLSNPVVEIDLAVVPNFDKFLREFEENLTNRKTNKTFNVEVYCNINNKYELYNFHHYDERNF